MTNSIAHIRTIFFPVIFSLIIFSCNENKTVNEIAAQLNQITDTVQSIEYHVDYKIKYFTNKDTTNIKGKCQFGLQSQDTLLGYKTRLQSERGYEFIYTMDKLYVFNHNNKSVLIDDPKKNGVRFITGNAVEGMIFTDLLNGIDLNKLKNDSVSVSLVDSKSNNNQWVIKIKYPDRDEFTDSEKKIWINKHTYLPERMTSFVRWNEMFQYKEKEIWNVKINDKHIIDNLNNIEISEGYNVEYYEPPSSDKYTTLKNGTTAPDFNLADLEGSSYQISELQGKIIILDFWYMSCYPCLKAMPKLEELYNKYKDRGLLILGINSKDKSRSTEEIKDFLVNRNIYYPTIVATNSIDSVYRVRAYPTLYVIDKKGKIKYSQIGFGDQTKDRLEEIILDILN